MTRFREPDVYKTATLIDGKPTCIFESKPYHRKITSVVVENSVPSTVSCYRGQLGTVPVSVNNLGSSNVLRGTIDLPAGQAFYVQWSSVGQNVSDATARVSFDRDNDPFLGGDFGHSWDNQEQTYLIIPNTAGPNDPQIFIGQDVPAAVQFAVKAFGRSTRDAIAVILYALDLLPDGTIGNAGDYWFDALTVDTTNYQLAKVIGVVSDQRQFYSWISEYVLPYDVNGPLGAMAPFLNVSMLRLLGDFTIDDVDAPRGPRCYLASQSNSPTVFTGARTTLLSGSMTWVRGRAYKISIGGRCLMSGSTNVLSLVVTSGGGDLWYPGAFGPSGASDPIAVHSETIVRRTSATATETVTLAGQVFDTGTGFLQGLPGIPHYLLIEDVGSVNSYLNSISF